MSYRPRIQITAGTNVRSRRRVDGSDTSYVAGAYASIAASSNVRVNNVISSLTRPVRGWGGALRSNGDFVPIPGNMNNTVGANNYLLAVMDFVGATHNTRLAAGSTWSGAGNVLTSGIVVFEVIP